MRVNFVGDIGIFRKYEELKLDPFERVSLPEADLNIGNFEFIMHKGRKKLFYDVQEGYSCSHQYLSTLKVDRFSGYGLANNHCLDYGLEGAEDTIELLESHHVKVFGFSNDASYRLGSFEKNGITMGVLAFVKEGRWSKNNHGFGPDSYDVSAVCEVIRAGKEQYDHLVVFPHWGTELIEIPDKADRENARRFIDAGASAVVGHHPHISQGIETYRGGLIAYSLGSFIYIPEEELGYSPDQENRDISICMHIEFNKQGIVASKAHFYRYDPAQKIPVILGDGLAEEYAAYLNNHIDDDALYHQQVRRGLLRREINSFLKRFRHAPLKTMTNYLRLLSFSRLRKLTGR